MAFNFAFLQQSTSLSTIGIAHKDTEILLKLPSIPPEIPADLCLIHTFPSISNYSAHRYTYKHKKPRALPWV